MQVNKEIRRGSLTHMIICINARNTFGDPAPTHLPEELLQNTDSVYEFNGFKEANNVISSHKVNGVRYLHANGIVHRDLMSADVLLGNERFMQLTSENYIQRWQSGDSPLSCKLTDFGEGQSQLIQINSMLALNAKHIDRRTAELDVCTAPPVNAGHNVTSLLTGDVLDACQVGTCDDMGAWIHKGTVTHTSAVKGSRSTGIKIRKARKILLQYLFRYEEHEVRVSLPQGNSRRINNAYMQEPRQQPSVCSKTKNLAAKDDSNARKKWTQCDAHMET
eukprot:gene8551-9464_t